MTYDTTVDEAALLASALCNVSLNEQKQEALDNMFDSINNDKPNLKVVLLFVLYDGFLYLL